MFIEPTEIRSLTTLSEVKDLTDDEISRYIMRADSWIRRATMRDYSYATDVFVQEDIRNATLLLVEYLWYWDISEMKEESMGHDEVYRIGSYSVNKKGKPEDFMTGIDELDNILKSYRYRPTGVNIFRISRKE